MATELAIALTGLSITIIYLITEWLKKDQNFSNIMSWIGENIFRNKKTKKDLERGILLRRKLDELREKYNASNCGISLFHNGGKDLFGRGFKKYGVKIESFDKISNSTINHYQDKPLTPYYEQIKNFEVDHIAFFFSEEQDRTVVHQDMDYMNIRLRIVTPLLTKKYLKDAFSIILNGQKYYVYGLLHLNYKDDIPENFNNYNELELIKDDIWIKALEISEIYKS